MKPFFAVILLLLAGQAIAGRTISLYDVDVLVTDESTTSRYNAFKKGLNEVFIRISGDSYVMDKLKPPAASRYVKQFSYVPLEEPEENAEGKTLSHRLKIHYNGSSMVKYLLDNGFPVWGEHRSDVVVWLAVRDGRNEYVLKEADQSLLKVAVDKALVRRGIPERWPLYDYKDRKKLSVADIRGGFRDPITAASKRYSRGPALAGSMIWNGKQWQSNWSLLMPGGDQYWSLVDSDYEQLVNKAIDQAADIMGNVYAIHEAEDGQQLVIVQLEVQAINSIGKYRRVENYLSNLNTVETVKPLRNDGYSVTFELILRSDEEDFLKMLHNDAVLLETEAIEPEPVEPEPVEPRLVEPESIESGPIESEPVKIEPVKPELENSEAVTSASTPTKPESSPAGQALTDSHIIPAEVAVDGAANGAADRAADRAIEDEEAASLLNQQVKIPLYYYKLIR